MNVGCGGQGWECKRMMYSFSTGRSQWINLRLTDKAGVFFGKCRQNVAGVT